MMTKKKDKAQVAPFEVTPLQWVLLKQFHQEIIDTLDLDLLEEVFQVIFDREPNPLDVMIMRQIVLSKAEEWGTEADTKGVVARDFKVLDGGKGEELDPHAHIIFVPYQDKVKAVTDKYDLITVHLLAAFKWNDRKYVVVHNTPEFGTSNDEIKIMRLVAETDEGDYRGQIKPIDNPTELEMVTNAWEGYHFE